MSILIEGMTEEVFFRILRAANCGMFQCEGECASYYGYRVKEIPPHGRLIDADRLEEEPCDVMEDRGFYSVFGYSLAQIKNAQTIIEAEGEKE